MDTHVYTDVEKSETGWWYRGRTHALQSIVPMFVGGKGSVLDVGSGFGAMHRFLSQFGDVYAYDTYPDCVAACKKRGYAHVYASLEELEGAVEQFSLIGAFDALEHMEHDQDVLRKLLSKLAPAGVFVATVPAHQFLFGAYDIAAHHFRRYSRQSLRTVFEKAGYDVVYVSYWNATLFLPAAVARLLGAGGTTALTLHPVLDTIFHTIVYLESLVLRIVPFPFGLSLILVARKKV